MRAWGGGRSLKKRQRDSESKSEREREIEGELRKYGKVRGGYGCHRNF